MTGPVQCPGECSSRMRKTKSAYRRIECRLERKQRDAVRGKAHTDPDQHRHQVPVDFAQHRLALSRCVVDMLDMRTGRQVDILCVDLGALNLVDFGNGSAANVLLPLDIGRLLVNLGHAGQCGLPVAVTGRRLACCFKYLFQR